MILSIDFFIFIFIHISTMTILSTRFNINTNGKTVSRAEILYRNLIHSFLMPLERKILTVTRTMRKLRKRRMKQVALHRSPTSFLSLRLSRLGAGAGLGAGNRE